MAFRIMFSLSLLIFLGSCKSTYHENPFEDRTIDNGYSTQDERMTLGSGSVVRPNEDGKANVYLGQMIARLPGVESFGDGNGMSFKVRGAASIYGGTAPLFVLDGRQVGIDFSSVAQVVDPNQVSSIRVLKGPDASIYGTRGANGVIVIRTKKL